MPLILEPTNLSSTTSFNYMLKHINKNKKISSTTFIEKIIPLQQLNKKIKEIKITKKSTVNFVKSFQQKKLIEKMNKKNLVFENEIEKARKEILNEKILESEIKKISYNKEFETMLGEIDISKVKVKYYGSNKTEYIKVINDTENRNTYTDVDKMDNKGFNLYNSISIPDTNEVRFFGDDKTVDSHISNSVSSFVSHFCNESYKFIKSKQDCIKFLNEQYKTHIKSVTNKDELDITLYTQLYCKNDTYNVEVYQGRFLYAEIYVCYRINDLQALVNLLCEFSYFFGDFKEEMQNYIANKKDVNMENGDKPKRNMVEENVNDDFKSLLYSLIKNEKCNKKVINTFETWLWYNLVTNNKNIIKNINTVKEEHYRLFGLILCSDYESAFANLKKYDFDILDRLFVAKEIIKKCYKKVKNSTMNDLQVFFTNLVFVLINTLKNEENKLKMIVFLKEIVSKEFYVENISKFLIKYDSFCFLRYSIFEENVISDICEKLILKNNKKKILAFWKLFDLRIVEKLYNEELKLVLCSDKSIENSQNSQISQNSEFDMKFDENNNVDSLLLHYKKILNAVNSQKSKSLYNLLVFKVQQNEVNLKNTVFYCEDAYFDLDVKEVCEKLIFEACLVAKNKFELGMKVLKNVGMMNVSKECMKIVNKELVRYI